MNEYYIYVSVFFSAITLVLMISRRKTLIKYERAKQELRDLIVIYEKISLLESQIKEKDKAYEIVCLYAGECLHSIEFFSELEKTPELKRNIEIVTWLGNIVRFPDFNKESRLDTAKKHYPELVPLIEMYVEEKIGISDILDCCWSLLCGHDIQRSQKDMEKV